MFCSKCGAQLPENSKFCEKCGTSVVQSGETVTEKKPNKGLWKKVLFGVLGIVIVLGVGIFAYSYYETEIVPEKVEEAVGSLNVVGYEMPIASAMDRFFDIESGNFYEYEVEKSDGQYYVTISGTVHGAHYDFHFWYDNDLSYVTISDVEADGEKLSESSNEEYFAFLDQVFGVSAANTSDADIDVPDVKAEPNVDQEPDMSSEMMPNNDSSDIVENAQVEDTADDERYWASDDFEPELHDFITEESDYEIELSLTYTRVFCGRFDLYANYYDANGNLVNEHETGVFDEDISGNGIIRFDTGEEGSYYVDYSTTPATLVLYGNDGIEVHMVDMMGM